MVPEFPCTTLRNDVTSSLIYRAYHGHSVAVMDLSPYKFKQPGGDGKKDYIHVVPCPDHYRGIKRGKNDEELGQFYADQVKQTIDSAHENGRKVCRIRDFKICCTLSHRTFLFAFNTAQ